MSAQAPQRRPKTTKTLRINVRLAPDEHRVLLEKARAVGLPLGTYLRELALGRRLRARRGHVDGRAIAQLSRVGNNLRQLGRVAADAGDTRAQDDLDATFADLQAVIDLFLAATSEDAS